MTSRGTQILENSFKVNKSEYVPNNKEKYGNSLDR
jgi:hypothetical protein